MLSRSFCLFELSCMSWDAPESSVHPECPRSGRIEGPLRRCPSIRVAAQRTRDERIGKCRKSLLLQAQHILHVVQPRRPRRQPQRRAQGAAREIGPAAGLVADLDALALAEEHHRVITHHVAAAHRGEADGVAVARTGVALPSMPRQPAPLNELADRSE